MEAERHWPRHSFQELCMKLESEERVTSLDPVFGPMGIEAGRALWQQSALSMREKAILLIAADVCVPEFGLPFELHVGMALGQAGMSVEDLREVLRHIAPDAGFNIVAMAFQRLVEVATALGYDTRSTASRLERNETVYAESTLDALRSIDPEFANDMDRTTRQLWHRPGLSRRERCSATFAVDVISGVLGAPFAALMDVCRDAGLSRTDCQAAIRVLAEFSRPKAWQALIAPDAQFIEPRATVARRSSR
jgi:alkylhydroperoxidase/carboxymuconolactone decarboxylase family protein YurZ